MTTVCIRGLGLIGTSLALSIRQQYPDIHLIGSDKADTLQYAQAHHIIDVGVDDLTGADTADVIILATPVSVIKADLKTLTTRSLKSDVIVTDVGSTKREVMAAAQPLIAKHVTFIGGHPMAGSHKSGVTAGRADLFENAFYMLVPGQVNPAAVTQLQKLLQGTHVKWLQVKPEEHDQLVGQLSHVPHVIAAALVNETQRQFATSPAALRLAAGGFKSITRIASSSPDMWTAIMQSNADTIATQLTDYQRALESIKTAVVNQDLTTIHSFFERAKQTRDQLGPERQGGLPGFYDFFINIPDVAGSLAAVTKQLADHHINLVNLHILEIREDVNGVLQLTFANNQTRQDAIKVLQPTFEIVRRD